MELLTLFKFVEVEVGHSSATSTLTFSTDMPGNALAVRATATIPATTGRHAYRITLPGWTKGKLYQLKVSPGGTLAIYSAKLYARVVGPAAAMWAWYAVPVLETPVEWQPIKLPIQTTSDDWSELKLPIQPTGEDWSEIKLPIQTTSDDWSELKLPIDPTPDTFAEMKLPIKPTPVVPDWVQIPIDS